MRIGLVQGRIGPDDFLNEGLLIGSRKKKMEVQNWSKKDILEAISAPTQKLHLLFGPTSGVIQIMNCQGMQKSATFFGRCFLKQFL